METIKCPSCGGNSFEQLDNGNVKCEFCRTELKKGGKKEVSNNLIIPTIENLVSEVEGSNAKLMNISLMFSIKPSFGKNKLMDDRINFFFIADNFSFEGKGGQVVWSFITDNSIAVFSPAVTPSFVVTKKLSGKLIKIMLAGLDGNVTHYFAYKNVEKLTRRDTNQLKECMIFAIKVFTSNTKEDPTNIIQLIGAENSESSEELVSLPNISQLMGRMQSSYPSIIMGVINSVMLPIIKELNYEKENIFSFVLQEMR